MDIKDIAKSAKEASLELLGAPSELKNAALKNVKENIERHKNEIFAANKKHGGEKSIRRVSEVKEQ